jgi:tRNA(adenine34) deaminase
MDDSYFQLVKAQYDSRGDDHSTLFQTILDIAEESSLDVALACLERCAVEKRTAWLEKNLEALQLTGDPVGDAYRIFYETYLGISAPDDGKIVERTPDRMVTRWWNRCPTLDACHKLGLDTREICRKAYHRPVQVFFSRINPDLRFDRNYEALRPHTPYCEEMISLEEQPPDTRSNR